MWKRGATGAKELWPLTSLPRLVGAPHAAAAASTATPKAAARGNRQAEASKATKAVRSNLLKGKWTTIPVAAEMLDKCRMEDRCVEEPGLMKEIVHDSIEAKDDPAQAKETHSDGSKEIKPLAPQFDIHIAKAIKHHSL